MLPATASGAEQLPAATASGAQQLLIFGDSWARSEDCDVETWPALLGERLGWREVVNLAEPGSSSSGLLAQATDLRIRGTPVDADAWCVVHTGGNDLYFAPPEQFAAFLGVGTARALCCCVPWRRLCGSRLPLLGGVADNIAAFMESMHATHGVSRFVLVGLPLTATLPFVRSTLASLSRGLPYLPSLGARLIRHVNALHLEELSRAGRLFREARRADAAADVPTVVTLDEAAALDSVHAKLAGAADALWEDISHPSRLCHRALAIELEAQLRAAAARETGGQVDQVPPTAEALHI